MYSYNRDITASRCSTRRLIREGASYRVGFLERGIIREGFIRKGASKSGGSIERKLHREGLN